MIVLFKTRHHHFKLWLTNYFCTLRSVSFTWSVIQSEGLCLGLVLGYTHSI